MLCTCTSLFLMLCVQTERKKKLRYRDLKHMNWHNVVSVFDQNGGTIEYFLFGEGGECSWGTFSLNLGKYNIL